MVCFCMSSTYEEKLYKTLDEIGVMYEKFEHPAFPTCDASGDYYQEHNMGVDCRNSFMQNRRGKKHYLVIMMADKKIDIPHLADFLGENKKMGFASEERLKNYLGLMPGSVTPFGLIHENARSISVVVDKNIFLYDHVHFHPLRNTASLKMSTQDLRKFFDHCGCEIFEYTTSE